MDADQGALVGFFYIENSFLLIINNINICVFGENPEKI
jgi:hypothetical protein